MTPRLMEAILTWKRRVEVNMEVLASAIENDDCELAIYCLLDMEVITRMHPDVPGWIMMVQIFGTERVASTLLQIEVAQIKEQNPNKWQTAMTQRGFEFKLDDDE